MASPVPGREQYDISDISVQVADLPLEPPAARASAGKFKREQPGFPFLVVMEHPDIHQQILDGPVYRITYHQSFEPWTVEALVKSDGKTPTTLRFIQYRNA